MLSSLGKSPLQEKLDSSMWFLIVANLFPLIGVLFWEWSTFEVVALYWLENVIIGAVNILKMVTCSPDLENFDLSSKLRMRLPDRTGLDERQQQKIDEASEMIGKFSNQAGALNHGLKLFLIPFFTFHYGLFCLVHGVFVFALLGGNGGFIGGGPFAGMSQLVASTVAEGGIWAALALTISHLFSFATNYLGKGEYRRTAVPLLMAAPYGRIVVLHIAILFGAFAIMALGSPLFLLVLLIAGKIALDLKLHRRSHQKIIQLSPRREPSG